MQLARDGKIILDLDHFAETNHISAEAEYSPLLHQQRPTLSYERRKSSIIAPQREELFTIQFGSLEPIVVPLIVQGSMVETNLSPIQDEK